MGVFLTGSALAYSGSAKLSESPESLMNQTHEHALKGCVQSFNEDKGVYPQVTEENKLIYLIGCMSHTYKELYDFVTGVSNRVE